MTFTDRTYHEVFPYDVYRPQQEKIIQDVVNSLKHKDSCIVVARNGAGKTILVLTAVLSVESNGVYILSRTHRQMAHFVEEIDMIRKNKDFDVKYIELLSRAKYCINPEVRNLDRDLIDIGCKRSSRFLHTEEAYCSYRGFSNGIQRLDIVSPSSSDIKHGSMSVIKSYARSQKWCPYYLARGLAQKSPVVIGTYMYIDRDVRRALGLDLEGKIIVFDECLSGDTLISMKDGSLKMIKNVKNGEEVVGGKVSNKFKRTSNSSIKITTSFGSLVTSPTHPNFTIHQRRYSKNKKCFVDSNEEDVEIIQSKDLEVGNFLLIPEKLSIENKTNDLNEKMAYFVGMIMSDGHLDEKGYRIKIDVRDEFKKSKANEIFSYIGKVYDEEVKKHTTTRKGSPYSEVIWINSKKIREILEGDFQIPKGKKSTKIDIVNKIMGGNENVRKSFIKSCFDCEGWVGKNRVVKISSTSELFIKKLKIMLLSFGIKSSIATRIRNNPNHNNLYRLTISGEDLVNFYNEIGFGVENKQQSLEKVLEKLPNRRLTKKVVFKNRVYRLSKIKSIEITEEPIEVYDFTTTSHRFIANGFLTHNCHNIPSFIEEKQKRTLDIPSIRKMKEKRGLTKKIMIFLNRARNFVEAVQETLEGSKQRKISYVEFGNIMSSCRITIPFLVGVSKALYQLSQNPRKYEIVYKISKMVSFFELYNQIDDRAFLGYVSSEREGRRSIVKVGVQSLDIAPSIRELVEEGAKLIFMSGTLDSEMFEFRLKLNEIQNDVHEYVFDDRRLQLYLSSHSNSKTPLTTAYYARNQDMYEEYGYTIQSLVDTIKEGMLFFFPSYDYKKECIEAWDDIGLISHEYDDDDRRVKYLKTPSGRMIRLFDDNSETEVDDIEDFKEYVIDHDACLFSAYRSRASEGEDYKNIKAIFIIGIPLANIQDAGIKLKMSYYDSLKSGYGQRWYNSDALNAVNQACGRGIRKEKDYCAIFLMDQRYRQGMYFNHLSRWIRAGLVQSPPVQDHIPEEINPRLSRFYAKNAKINTIRGY